MASKIGSEQEVIAEINVVPLVDIILVVLIIFMVTAPLIMKPNISVNLPKASSGNSTESESLTIVLTADGKTLIGAKEVDSAHLIVEAQSVVAKNPEVQVIISADKEVSHGKVVSIMDAIKEAGVKRFGISIEKK